MAVDATKVRVGAVGKVYHAPLLTVLPTDTTTALNVAFLEVGYIADDGLTGEPDENTSDIRAWGGDLVRRVISEYGESYSFILEALIEGGVSTTRPFVRALHREVAQAVTGRISP